MRGGLDALDHVLGRDVGIVQRLRHTLAHTGIGPRPHVLLGFSGGTDSVALLVALRALARQDLLRLTAIHVDHGMRDTSVEEARQVVTLAGDLGVACELWTVDADDVNRHRGVGIEEALRRERYRAFAVVRQRIGAEVVATAHHQRDQAETVLLHLLRGAGLRGASGMRPLSELSVPWWDDSDLSAQALPLWRPLLEESVVALHRFVAAFGLPVVEDPSNSDPAFRRNAIRHEVLPLLERLVPGATFNLTRFAGLVADDDAALDTVVGGILGGMSEPGSGLLRASVIDLPLGLQRRIIRQWVLSQVPGIELTSERTEAVLTMVRKGEGGKRVEIGDGWLVVLQRNLLTLQRSSAG